MAYRDYSTAKGHIVDASGFGDFTTITAALAAATAGQTIFVRPGTYTENPPLIAGVNISAFPGDSQNPNVKVIGKFTYSGAGTVSIDNIEFQTNSDFAIAVSGSSASVLNLNNCFINATNNTAISFASSSSSSAMNCFNCNANTGTTGITIVVSTAAGPITFYNLIHTNSGSSTTACSSSVSGLNFVGGTINFPVSVTGTANTNIIGTTMATINTVGVTTAGTGQGTLLEYVMMNTGNASSVSVGTGTLATLNNCRFTSSNTNVITGAGTVNYGINTLPTSKEINTTTQTCENSSTFTPGMAFGGSATGITYASQAGEYTVWGNVVYFNIIIALSSKGAQTGNATITGLPLTLQATAVVGPIPMTDNITFTASNTLAFFQGVGASTTLNLLQTGPTVTHTALTNTNFANNSNIQFQGFYFIA